MQTLQMSDPLLNGSGHRKWKVFIVDNHPMVRVRLAALIERERNLEVCGESEAPAALPLINQGEPDLVILDISSERSGGLDLLKQLKALHPKLRVLALSLHGDRLHVAHALRAGASGYLTKQEATVSILPAIQSVLEGKAHAH